VGHKSVVGCPGVARWRGACPSSQRTFVSLNRRAHQTMGSRQMNADFEQFLATIIEQCLDEHDMQPPLVVRTVVDNGSLLVADFNEGAELSY
jgi:hypothetical protein